MVENSGPKRYLILVVDDETRIARMIRMNLEHDGYEVIEANSGQQALDMVRSRMPNLVILDVMMPGLDGYETLQILREISQVPVIMLTALDDDFTKIQTFDLHADEYVDKPVSPQVMTRRIHALTDRIYGQGSSCTVKGYTFDFPRYLVIDQKGNEIHFTNKEMGILRYLLENRGKAVSRDSLITNLWGCEYESEERAIDTHIKNIRKKLDPDIILTIKGIGYRLNL